MSVMICTKLLRSMSILALVAVFCMSQTATALTAEQKKIYRDQVFFYDHDPSNSLCGNTSAPGGGGTVTTDMESFIDTYGQFAYNVGKKNGIPYDSILAQASVESNYGQSKLNQQANNFFGIKAGSSWTGPTVTFQTREENADGSSYYVDAKFEAYPSPEAGFQGYVDFLRRNPRYADVFNYQRDSVGFFRALKDAGYATEDEYVEILTSRLSTVRTYIASKDLFPPIAEVEYEVQPPGSGGAPGSTGSCSFVGTGDAAAVVAVAIREAQNWTGAAGAYKKYTDGRGENWCADFVSWVYREAGRPFTAAPGVALVNGWQIPSVSSLRTYLQIKGQYWEKSSAPAPQPGDIVIYKNGASHTNIVVEASGYMVKTVGGNQGSSNGQGAFYETSDVTMSPSLFDLRSDSTVSGWGRLP